MGFPGQPPMWFSSGVGGGGGGCDPWRMHLARGAGLWAYETGCGLRERLGQRSCSDVSAHMCGGNGCVPLSVPSGTSGGPHESLGLRHSALLPPCPLLSGVGAEQTWSNPTAGPTPGRGNTGCAQPAVGQRPAWWPRPHPVPAAILLLLQSALTSPLLAPLTLQPRLFMVSLSFSHDFQGNEAHGLWPRTGASSMGLAQHSALPLPSLLLGVRRERAYSAVQGAACCGCCCMERGKTQRANVKCWKGRYGGAVMATGSSLGAGPCVELWDAVRAALWPNREPSVSCTHPWECQQCGAAPSTVPLPQAGTGPSMTSPSGGQGWFRQDEPWQNAGRAELSSMHVLPWGTQHCARPHGTFCLTAVHH